jgi:hypothetical protein
MALRPHPRFRAAERRAHDARPPIRADVEELGAALAPLPDALQRVQEALDLLADDNTPAARAELQAASAELVAKINRLMLAAAGPYPVER